MGILGQAVYNVFTLKEALRDIMSSPIKSVSSLLMDTWSQHATWTSPDYRTNVKKRYTFNELIYACVTLNAMASTQVSFRVKDRDSGQWDDEHPFRKLIEHPNRFMSETDLLEAIVTLQFLAGRAVLEKERNRKGEVIGLWPLRPDWLELIPSKTEIIAGFRFGPPGGEKNFIPYRDVVDLPLRNPGSPIIPFETLAPVSVAARVVDVDSSTTEYVKLFFEKGGIPPGILKTKKKLIDSDVKDLRKRWRERYGGYANWLEPAVLDLDAEYQSIGATFEEMGFIVLDRRNESRICMIMQVPPIVVGAYAGLELGSYDNYLTARKAWWEDGNVPRFERILDRLQLELATEYKDNPLIALDLSEVEALQENREVQWRVAADAVRTGALTVNMYLKEIGKSPIGPQGDVFLRPLASVEVPLKSVRRKPPKDDGKLLTVGKVDRPDDYDDRAKFEDQMVEAFKDQLAETFEHLKEEIAENGAEAILAQ